MLFDGKLEDEINKECHKDVNLDVLIVLNLLFIIISAREPIASIHH